MVDSPKPPVILVDTMNKLINHPAASNGVSKGTLIKAGTKPASENKTPSGGLKDAYERALKGEGLTRAEALEFTNADETRIFDILKHTDAIRREFKGVEINLCSIVNAKSGECAEDCSFCSQSVHYDTGVDRFPLLEASDLVEAAKEAEAAGAREFSIVTSGTGLDGAKEVDTLVQALKGMDETLTMERCASLGILDQGVLTRLKEAGLESYHHNLETARSFFPEVCTTHDYEDDVNTIKRAKEAGFYICSGGVFGLGESWAQRVELIETLRDLKVDSVPINFLNPRPGTPLEAASGLTPLTCLKIIALVRLMLPRTDIVVCGGREKNLRDLSPLIFSAGANGMMIGNYLTTKGREVADDLQMLEDLGLRPRPTPGRQVQ